MRRFRSQTEIVGEELSDELTLGVYGRVNEKLVELGTAPLKQGATLAICCAARR